MSDLLSIGKSAVNAYSTALAAISENVANASTAGYTRRSVTISQVGAGATGLSSSTTASFNGSTVTGVTRAWNDYQAQTTRTAMGDAGRADARLTWLTNAQSAMDDGTTGVGQSATAFFNAASTLASNPTSTTDRAAMLSALNQTTSALNTTATALASTSQGIATAAQTTVQSVNNDLDSLAKINASLQSTRPGTSAQADLEDQRDNLLNEISGNIGIDVTIRQDGSATVSLAQGGIQLVAGNGAAAGSARLTVSNAANGALSVQAVSGGTAQAVGDAGGELGGMVESAGIVADKRTSLDTLATNFITAVNTFQAAGTDSAGTAGQPLLSGTGAADIAVTTTDPTKIAAASSAGANGNLLTLTSLRGSDGIETQWTGMVTDQGQLVSSATSENSAASARSDAATSTQDTASGVDLDTEAAELVRYQQMYSGAAKVIQVAQATMQSILDLF
ncbi:MAG TPA: flagellar hook-associated protein FlgK [Sphingomonas sp.]